MKDFADLAETINPPRRTPTSSSNHPSQSSKIGGPDTMEETLKDIDNKITLLHSSAIASTFTEAEKVAIEDVKQVVLRLKDDNVTKGQAKDGDAEKLKNALASLEKFISSLDGEKQVVSNEDVKSKRNSGEWVVVGDEDDFLEVQKEKTPAEIEQIESLKSSLTALCSSINTLLSLLSAVPPPQQPTATFAEPLKITSFLGTEFPFPSEYSFAELEAIIRVRFATGPGSRYIQNGQWELLDNSCRSKIFTSRDTLKPGSKLLLVPVIDGVSGSGYKCPNPKCQEASTSTVKEEGRVCHKCGTWYYHSKLPQSLSPDGPATSADEKSKEKGLAKVASIPYKPDQKVFSTEEDVSLFKYIKTYPLTDLNYPIADQGEKKRFYCCKDCNTHLALHDSIMSRNFRGHHGKAYLFQNAYNITRGPTVERNMTTGKHDICDVYCRGCGAGIGWAYERAEYESEEYKVGKFLLEAEMIVANGLEIKLGPAEIRYVSMKKGESESKERGMELLSKVTTVKGELLGLEYLEERLRALMDEEIGLSRENDGY